MNKYFILTLSENMLETKHQNRKDEKQKHANENGSHTESNEFTLINL